MNRNTVAAGMRALEDRKQAAGARVRLGWVAPNQLKVPEYQGPLQPRRVAEIRDGFDARFAGTLVVAERADGFYALDGQHRAEAARQAGYGDVAMRAEIWTGLSPHDEREMYLALAYRREQTRANTVEVKAELGSPVEAALVRMCQERAIEIANSRPGHKQGGHMLLTGIKAATDVIELRGSDHLAWCFDVLLAAFAGEQYSLGSEMLAGVAQFHAAHPSAPKGEVVATLRRVGVGQFKIDAKRQRIADESDGGRRTGYHYGRALLTNYNYRRTSGRLMDAFNDLAEQDRRARSAMLAERRNGAAG